MQIIKFRSTKREEMLEITGRVQKVLSESGKSAGVCILFVQHTTCGLTINENADPDVQTDILHALRKIVPQYGMDFKHAEENSDAHLKASLFGSSATIPFSENKLVLGRWQGIYLCDFDGPRERSVSITIL